MRWSRAFGRRRCGWCFLPSLIHCLLVLTAQRIVNEKRRLENEEEVAEDALVKLQLESSRIHHAMNTQFALIMRLRRQRKRVEEKGMDMVRRGFSSIDELEKAEDAEKAAEEAARENSTFHDWSSENASNFWASLGLEEFVSPSAAVDETPSASVVRS